MIAYDLCCFVDRWNYWDKTRDGSSLMLQISQVKPTKTRVLMLHLKCWILCKTPYPPKKTPHSTWCLLSRVYWGRSDQSSSYHPHIIVISSSFHRHFILIPSSFHPHFIRFDAVQSAKSDLLKVRIRRGSVAGIPHIREALALRFQR